MFYVQLGDGKHYLFPYSFHQNLVSWPQPDHKGSLGNVGFLYSHEGKEGLEGILVHLYA